MPRNSYLIALCLAALSCGKQQNAHYKPTSQVLRFNLHSEPPTLDPRKATDTVSASILNLCFEGLTRIDAQGEPILAAAEKMTLSYDKTRYTFTLRDAHWSDGRPVTAQDFEKSWKTLLDPTFACEFASDLYIIKNARAVKSGRCSRDELGVRSLDEKTLQVDLEHPVPYFLAALATHRFFPTPEHVTSAYSNWTEEQYVGNGPFFMKQWRHHDLIELEKSPQYWDRQAVKLEKVHLTLVEDEMTELNMFEQGELDWAGYPLSNLPTEALAALQREGGLHTYSIAGTYFYMFNTQAFPFTNCNMRRAFSLAIDREAIVSNVTQMGQLPATGLVPQALWKREISYFADHDLVEARRLFALGLEELGVAAEELSGLTLSYNTHVGHHKIAQAIQEQWNKAFGIKVKLENKEWKVFLDSLCHHQFQIARMGGLADVHDPIAFLDFFRYLSSSTNHSQWSAPQFTELLEKADVTVDPEKRISLLQAAEKILIDAMPVAPIYFYSGTYLKKPYVKGIHLSDLNTLDLKEAYVELND